ncbi:fascin domain-containing protein [Nonomuraea indica]|uniref:fascin domain-containing protein n=1 Tax=Nonomuraea indica TaxID=1581193 RepID=UPI0011825220|nr:hypothetical protein [Nonomuraea indica]
MIRKLGTMRGRRGNTPVRRRLNAFGAVLVALSASMVGVAQPASADVACLKMYIVNGYTGHVVSAELGDTRFPGMLRARAGSVGPWEKFERCIDQNTDTFTLRSLANNRYVSVEMNYTGSYKYMLRARATTVGPWERFKLYPTTSYYMDAFKGSSNLFVSTEMSYSGSDKYMLRARAASMGEWEIYRFGVL